MIRSAKETASIRKSIHCSTASVVRLKRQKCCLLELKFYMSLVIFALCFHQVASLPPVIKIGMKT